jgi:predicted metal-dependent phosphoesterase TrpH
VIDLHTHTSESDGTDAPAELLTAAAEAGIRCLSITDHDTFAGFDSIFDLASDHGVRLWCGVELSCLHESKTVHLLGYFGWQGPPQRFRDWVNRILDSRRERNLKLIDRLNALGCQIALAEVEQYGRSVTGRPHFARVLVEKGYAKDRNDAFHRFIGEEGSAFVERHGPSLTDAIEEIKVCGGVSSLAHPVRLGMFRSPENELQLFASLREAGLDAIEVYHSDHAGYLVERYSEFAALLGLLETGGSDYHGANKPGIALGSVPVPASVLQGLEAAFAKA